MITTDLCTIRDLIRYAASRFNENQLYFGHGTDNAWDEAVALILHTLHIPHILYNNILDCRLVANEKKVILALIDKRIQDRIPVAYLTHEAWFANLAFYVDERVLIPRSPIAELIQAHFNPWIDPENVFAILDLCTGSGCIAIACAKAFPNAHVVASDISLDALTVARINVLRHHLTDEIHLVESNVFTNIPTTEKFDIIVSNPPYVSNQEMVGLFAEYHHEPKLGLAAGTKGLDIVIEILRNASHYLSDHGILVVEVGNSEIALSEEFPDVPFTWLEFECGGDGVFVLTATELKRYFCESHGQSVE